jgi:hypothetical protein
VPLELDAAAMVIPPLPTSRLLLLVSMETEVIPVAAGTLKVRLLMA